jgi:protocatechuate 3,4-dioxygenase beta subunit
VVDSVTGQRLNKVTLRLEPKNRRSGPVSVARTDAGGKFSITGVESGEYRLKAKRAGYMEMFYAGHQGESQRTEIRLDAGTSLSEITFKLTPAAVVFGTIRDADGEPLEGAHVVLGRFTYEYGSGRIEGLRSTEADDRGEYRFRGLPAGKYYVGVEPAPDGWDEVYRSADPDENSSIATLYPGVRELSAATAIEVTAGKTVSGIDVTLMRSRTYRVSGAVLNAPGSRITVALRDKLNSGMRNYDLRTSTAGRSASFEFPSVPPGSYDVIVRHQSLSGKTAIEVGADVKGVEVALLPGAEVRLKIAAEEGNTVDLTTLEYFLTPDGRSGYAPLPQQSDKYTLPNVAPDRYMLHLSGPALRKLYVKSAMAGTVDVLREGLSISGPGVITINVILSSEGGRLSGTVRDGKGHSCPGAVVILLPQNPSEMHLFKTSSTDQKGAYELTGIVPGKYSLLASEEVQTGEWYEPGFLKKFAKHAVKVEVAARGSHYADVPVAEAQDVQ